MKSYLFEIPGEPFGKQRARTLKTGRSYTPAKTVQFENLVKTCFVQKYPCEPLTDDFSIIEIIAVYPVPKSWSKKDKIKADEDKLFPKRHDWDNIGKIVCDGLQGVLFNNDNIIFEGHVHKRFGDRPRTVVMVTVLEESDLVGKMRMPSADDIEGNYSYYVWN